MRNVQCRKSLRFRRGVTLFEVLIVVAILALISGGVAIGVIHHWVNARERTAMSNARTLRAAVKTWWIDHEPSACPSVAQLIADGALDRDSPKTDAWGSPWRLQCASNDVTVISIGRDQRENTPDDIRIPPFDEPERS